MPMSDHPFVSQVHADRTARIVSGQRLLRMPTLSLTRRFGRRSQAVAVRPVTTC